MNRHFLNGVLRSLFVVTIVCIIYTHLTTYAKSSPWLHNDTAVALCYSSHSYYS